MYEILPEIWKLMNRLMKQEKVLTVLTVSNFIEFDLFRVDLFFSLKIFKS